MWYKRRNGQSIGEYAILLGIVLGAVFAIQNFIRNRIAGCVQQQADTFAVGGIAGQVVQIKTKSDSVSTADAKFSSSGKGTVEAGSRAKSETTNVVQ